MARLKYVSSPVTPPPNLNSYYGCLTCAHSQLGRNVPLEGIKCELDHLTVYGRQCKKYKPAKGKGK
jgi:hypothetical protein